MINLEGISRFICLRNKPPTIHNRKQILAYFGDIIDVGIAIEHNNEFFMGSGYAVLNVHLKANTESRFQTFNHQLPWCKYEPDIFHAI
jgi:hypothetical protein